MTGTSDTIDAAITGNVSGQIAVGKDIFQVQTLQLTNHGGVVNLAPATQIARPQPRATPAPFKFRSFRDLLDRESERALALEALAEQSTLEVTGEPGIGKSALLRYLANAPDLPGFADGVICLGQTLVAGKSADDLLQTLFDAFYECAIPYKPSNGELRLALQDKRFLLIIDDCELDRDDANALLDAVPSSLAVLAGETPRLFGEGRSIAVHGLPIDAALRLLERGLGRELRDDELPAARDLCQTLAGHPLRILQAAAMMRDEQADAAAMLQRMQAAGSATTPAGMAMAALTTDERRVLSALAAPEGIRLHANMLGAVTGLTSPQAALDRLEARGLVESEAGAYRLSGSFSAYEMAVLESSAQPAETLSQITRWAADGTRTPAEKQANGDVIMRMLEWGAGANMSGETLSLASHTEASFALSGSWDAWSRVLEWQLASARAQGDRAAEAWALHQLGTRALCLNDMPTARSSLGRALEIREELGDEAGSAVTRHNLELSMAAPVVQTRVSEERSRWPAGKLLAGLAALLGAGALALWRLTAPPEPVPPTLTPLVTPSAVSLGASSTPLVLVTGPTSTASSVLPTATTRVVDTPSTATPSPRAPTAVTPSPTRDIAGPGLTPGREPLPDLLVESIQLGARPTFGGAPGLAQQPERLLVPVRVTVRNAGTRPAPVFKLSASFTRMVGPIRRETDGAPFVAPGQRDPDFVFTTSPLAAGATVSISGVIVLPLSMAGQSVALEVMADSCASEQAQPPYCRVQEGNEDNNVSEALQVQLPLRPSVTPTRTLSPTRTIPPTPTRTPGRVTIG
jgi:hypothetical protein